MLRIGGQDGTDTAHLLTHMEITPGNAGFAFSSTTANLTRGDDFPDGLAGSVVAGNTHTPILLTETPTTLGQYLTGYLNFAGNLATPTTALVIFGGPLAITPATAQAAAAQLGVMP